MKAGDRSGGTTCNMIQTWSPFAVNPEFQAILAEIKTDMSAQMQRIREMEQSGEIETMYRV